VATEVTGAGDTKKARGGDRDNAAPMPINFFEKGLPSAPSSSGPAWCAWVRRGGAWQLVSATQDGRVQAHAVADPNGAGTAGAGCRPLSGAAAASASLGGGGGNGGGSEASPALSFLAASADGRTLVACQDQYVKVRVVCRRQRRELGVIRGRQLLLLGRRAPFPTADRWCPAWRLQRALTTPAACPSSLPRPPAPINHNAPLNLLTISTTSKNTQLLSTSTLEPVGTAGRQMLPVRAAALCPSAAPGVAGGGSAEPGAPPPMLLALGGDDPTVKLVALPGPDEGGEDGDGHAAADEEDGGAARCARARAFRSVVGDGYVCSLAIDPDGRYAAACLRDGSVAVWDAADGKQVARKRVGLPPPMPPPPPPAAAAAAAAAAALAAQSDRAAGQCLDWHPDGGALLAAPGDDADVALIERLSWRTVAYLAHPRAHGAAVTALSFSPNGLYCASASGEDGRVAVWRVNGFEGGTGGGGRGGGGDGGALVRTARVVAAGGSLRVTRLAWHPSADCLAISGACGGVAVWRGVVSSSSPSSSAGGKRAAAAALPSPWRSVDELLREADKSGRRGGDADNADTEDGTGETDGGAGGKDKKGRRRDKRRRGRSTGATASSGGGDDDGEGEDDDDDSDGGGAGEASKRGADPRRHDRGKRPRAGASADEEEEEEDEDEGGEEEDDEQTRVGRRRPHRRSRGRGGAAAPKPSGRAVQAPVQPGATKPSAADAALYATTTKSHPSANADPSRLPRFLAYTGAGCVVARPLESARQAGGGTDGAGGEHGAGAALLPRAQALEVAFHDAASAGRARCPVLTDYYGVTLAALGARGVAYASPPSSSSGGGGGGADGQQDDQGGQQRQPAMLLFRPFGAWAAGSDWSAALPDAGEAPRCLAVGASWVAVATSRRLLRVYSLAGRQLAVSALPGDVVALAASGGGGGQDGGGDKDGGQEDEGEGDRLAVAWAEGPPEQGTGSGYDGTQRLSVWVARVREGGLVGVGGGVGGSAAAAQGAPCRLPLSPGASLRWLGFSEPEGLLAAYDTAGVLRVKPCAGLAAVEAWTPVFDAASPAVAEAALRQQREQQELLAGGGGGDDDRDDGGGGGGGIGAIGASSTLLFGVSPATVWPVSVSSTQLLCVVCRDARAQCGPPVVPKPVLTALPLSVPSAPADGAPAAVEDEWLRARLACRARGTAAAAAVGSDPGVVADVAAAAAAAAAAGGGADDPRAAAARAASDKAGLRLFHAALKGGRLARALELVGALALDRSVEGALRLAAHQRGAAALADRVAAYLEARRAQLEEAVQQRQRQRRFRQRGSASGAGVGGGVGGVGGASAAMEADDDDDDGGDDDDDDGVGGHGGGGDDDEDGGAGGSDQQQQQQQQPGAPLPSSAAAVAAFAVRFHGGGNKTAAAGGAGAGSSAAGGAAASMLAPARRAAGGSANPFARVRR